MKSSQKNIGIPEKDHLNKTLKYYSKRGFLWNFVGFLKASENMVIVKSLNISDSKKKLRK